MAYFWFLHGRFFGKFLAMVKSAYQADITTIQKTTSTNSNIGVLTLSYHAGLIITLMRQLKFNLCRVIITTRGIQQNPIIIQMGSLCVCLTASQPHSTAQHSSSTSTKKESVCVCAKQQPCCC